MDEIIGLFKSPATSISPASSTRDRDLATEDSDGPSSIREEEMSGLEALPAEIINHVLAFLPPVALAQLSRTSHLLRSFANNELLWSGFVRENLSYGEKVRLPSSAKSWRHLFVTHHPYWFLPRHKLWFADSPNTGKIMLARYSQARGCIEAHQLIAEHGAHTVETWTLNTDVLIHTFNPKVRLWLDDPVVILDMKDDYTGNCLQEEVAMNIRSQHHICSMISLCQPIPRPLQDHSMALWPPPIIPCEQRVRNESGQKFRTKTHRPRSLKVMSDQTFRVRKWLQFSNLMQPLNSVRMGEEVMTFSTLPEDLYTPTKEKPYQGLWVGDYSGHGCEFLLVLQKQVASRTTMSRRPSIDGLPGGMSLAQMQEETLEERDAGIRLIVDDLATPATPEEIQFPSEAGPSTGDPERMDEPESSYTGISSSTKPSCDTDVRDQSEQNLDDGSSGRLEAIKLTGDINVPRGQYTWIAEDIGPDGLIRIGKEQMFAGARIVKSWGRIAGRGFKHDRYVPSQLILISHDMLAQYWEVSAVFSFGHLKEAADLSPEFWSYLFLPSRQYQRPSGSHG